MENVRKVRRLTRKEVPIAVRFILSPLLTVGHRGHLLGRGASHLLPLLLRSSPPHSWSLLANLEAQSVRNTVWCVHIREKAAKLQSQKALQTFPLFQSNPE